MDPKNDPVVKFALKRINQLSAKFPKTDGDKKVHEFAGRDQYGRYRNEDGSLRVGGGLAAPAALGAGGLYLRGRFAKNRALPQMPGARGLAALEPTRFPRSSGLGHIGDTINVGARNLYADVGRASSRVAGSYNTAASRMSAGFNTAAARGATATTSGKAWMQSLFRRLALRGRAG